MTKPYWINLKTTLQRVPFVLKRKGYLSELHTLAETITSGLQKSETQEYCCRLDFVTGKIDNGISLPNKICELMRKVQIHELVVKLDTGGIRYVGAEFPNKELSVAIKFALRTLAMKGKRPLSLKEANLSSMRKPAKKHRGYQQGVEVNARATLSQGVSLFEAGLTLSYHIDAGRVPLSIVTFGGKIDG